MTKLLYLEDCYLKEFDAAIVENRIDYVVLDKTAFYPISGGQPSDKGTLDNIQVVNVKKVNNEVHHYIKEPIKKDLVHGVIDWSLRYKHMRMHTAQHLVSAIVLDKYNAETVGNQINADISRIDFHPFKPVQEDLDFITKKFNEIVDKSLKVKKYFTTRDTALREIDEKRRNLFQRVPEFVSEIRVVEIETIDKCPCGGTHVGYTSEIKYIDITKTENKGQEKTRLSFELKNEK